MLAAGVIGHALIDHFIKGNEISSPADNSMEQSDNMPEERQRRFLGQQWGKVRFLISHELKIDFL